jgi:glutaredoxin
MDLKILIFSLNGCGYCQQLKSKLNDNSIPYQDIEITKNKPIWDQVVSQTGQNFLPTIFIQKDNEGNGSVFTPEKDFKSIEDAVELIKEQLVNKEE